MVTGEKVVFSNGVMIHHFNPCVLKAMPGGYFNLRSPCDVNGSLVAEMNTWAGVRTTLA